MSMGDGRSMMRRGRIRRIRMEDFISRGCGSVERDRWVTSMIRMCLTVSCNDADGGIDAGTVTGRGHIAETLDGMYGMITKGFIGGEIDWSGIWSNRLRDRSRGTDRNIIMGSMLDFAVSADPAVLNDLTRIYDRATGRMEQDRNDTITSWTRRRILVFRHLIAPLMAGAADSGFMPIPACTSGFLPYGLISPSLDMMGYGGPEFGSTILLEYLLDTDVMAPQAHLIIGVENDDDMLVPGVYSPAITGAMYENPKNPTEAFVIVSLSGSCYSIIDHAGAWPEWIMPAARRRLPEIGTYRMECGIGRGLTVSDLAWAASGPLEPDEVDWLLNDVDWDSPVGATEIMRTLSGMAEEDDPGAWTRIMWRPLAAAIGHGDGHGAVVAMHAFHVATSPLLPRFIISVDRDGGRQLMHVTLIPDHIPDIMSLPTGFLREDMMASGIPVVMRLPGVDGEGFDRGRRSRLISGLTSHLGIGRRTGSPAAPSAILDRLGMDAVKSWEL